MAATAAEVRYTELDNKVDELVERMEDAQAVIKMNVRGCLTHSSNLVETAAALQAEIRAEIRRSANLVSDHELESMLIGYSKLLASKLDLVEVNSDYAASLVD